MDEELPADVVDEERDDVELVDTEEAALLPPGGGGGPPMMDDCDAPLDCELDEFEELDCDDADEPLLGLGAGAGAGAGGPAMSPPLPPIGPSMPPFVPVAPA